MNPPCAYRAVPPSAHRALAPASNAVARLRGFTLIELVIAVLVVGILLTVAYPSYLDQIRKSRRADAFTALQAVQQAQERWRANRTAFADDSQLTAAPNAANAASAGLGLQNRSGAGYYDIAIASSDATGYVVTAQARNGTSQAADSACARLGVRMVAGNVGYGSGTSALDWADSARCWPR